jgi:hypothetical protein
MNNTCFVIQPFDGAQFDKRYQDIVEPAIEAANLIPYRVDQDDSVIIPIDDIEAGIRNARICIAEISSDNPNVWYELGYALACKKNVILLCSEDRKKFPFDIQHRIVLRYKTESSSDFTDLKERITQKAKALLKKDQSLHSLSVISDLAPVSGLNQQEMAVLISLAGNLETPEDHVSAHLLRSDVEQSGFTKIACVIGIKSLTSKGLIDFNIYTNDYNHGHEYQGYSLTDKGWEWVMSNQDKFTITEDTQLDEEPPF